MAKKHLTLRDLARRLKRPPRAIWERTLRYPAFVRPFVGERGFVLFTRPQQEMLAHIFQAEGKGYSEGEIRRSLAAFEAQSSAMKSDQASPQMRGLVQHLSQLAQKVGDLQDQIQAIHEAMFLPLEIEEAAANPASLPVENAA